MNINTTKRILAKFTFFLQQFNKCIGYKNQIESGSL
ncbi:hypothetical protein tinsulaeT_15460 [Thalassotalea insulae]|uniref:Uncharacterized protein n=1 Tax=Thalassotalea insulae TaxID=2056778 RepID=A0ABQ6GQN7_9GAMM|nr:hypothetical protein tinsulaeT_15460 [Thalassotalea insulae]